MAINPTSVVNAVKDNLEDKINFSNATVSEKLITAIVTKVLKEITTKGQVNVTITGTSATGGPVTGTGTGTLK